MKLSTSYQKSQKDNKISCVLSRSDVSIQTLTLNKLEYNPNQMSLLDYFVEVNPLKETVFAKSNQEWSVVGFEINLKRKSYKYIFNFFFPSCALATISLVS